MGFQLHQSHSLTVTGLKGGKKSKYWVIVGLLEISKWVFQIKASDLKFVTY